MSTTMNSPVPNPTAGQLLNGLVISIVKPTDGPYVGQRFVSFKTTKGRRVNVLPVSICGLAACKDRWMRDIKVRCSECRTVTTCGNLQDGEYCPDCVTRFEQENAELDAS